MSKHFPVAGLADVNAFLSAFPKNVQKNAVRSALRQAAVQIAREAEQRAPGRIANSIKVGSAKANEDGTVSIRIYVDERKGSIGFVGYFMEYGVAPHLIARTGKGEGRVAVRRAKEGKGKVKNGVMKIGDRYVSGTIHHPGHAAHPFMRPALDAKATQAIQAFADTIQSYLYDKSGLLAPYVDVGEAA
ncbi:MAG: HK97 gp10 family phage protein [Novosphingobium sp.]|nr:HK97 gp10 family phage protein [Novosphingobium sp.]